LAGHGGNYRCSENLKGIHQLGNLGVDRHKRTIFERIKEKWYMKMWTRLNWPGEGSIGRFWEHGDESSGVLDQLDNC
jgi:hypothetical protein